MSIQPVVDDVDTGTRFGVLGSLEVWTGQDLLRFPATRQRTIIAVLLANVNRPVTMDTLVTELWSETPPSTARKTVQGYIWRIRRTLARSAGLLTSTEYGYRLTLDGADLDALEFTALVRSARLNLPGRPDAAALELTRALGLWRGPAYASVPGSLIVNAEAARLDEARTCAYELMMTAYLYLGRQHEAIPDLTWLAAVHPQRESVHRLLMAALFRAGRRLDALSVYARLRRQLADEYGLDPQRETVALHQEILRGTATVELAACV